MNHRNPRSTVGAIDPGRKRTAADAPFSRNLRQHPVFGAHRGLALALGALALALQAQPSPSYAGRPFVLVARNNLTDPVAGLISGFGRAQLLDNWVTFVPMQGVRAGGVFRGRGGPLDKVAAPGTAAPGGSLQFFHDAFARDTGASAQLVLAAGPARADALYLTDGTNVTTLLASGTVLPNSGGKTANVLGEPYLARDALAAIAWHTPASGGVDFRGVYRVASAALQPVADTATALPGGFGVPDTFSSQVGFDGQTLAFWASRGPLGADQGMFVQPEPGQPVTLIARQGDSFPGGGTIDGFISPPVAADGAVFFFAYDASNRTRLLRYEAGALTTVARDGDATAEGGTLASLGQFGLAVAAGKVFFPALVGGAPGLYVAEAAGLLTVIAPGTIVGGLRPAALVLQDVAGDTLVVEAADTSFNRRLVANLAAPAVPVILSSPTDRTVAPGTRVALTVRALGDAPLSYSWQWSSPTGLVTRSTADTLTIEAAGAGDVGYYSLRVTNAFGAAAASFLFNVEAPPLIAVQATNTTVEAGDQLVLRVTALGGLPLGYAWTKDGAPVTSDSPTPGVFVRTTARTDDAGRYRVMVTNAFGQALSAEATVTVTPAAPNPVHAGQRLAAVLDPTVPLPGTTLRFDVAAATARFWGTKLAFAGRATNGTQLGVFVWDQGAWSPLLAPNVPLPNDQGTADGFALVRATPDEPLILTGLKAGVPVGLYRLNGATLEPIADVSLPAPDAGGARFANFFGDAIHAAGRTLFVAVVAGKPGLYLRDATGLRRVLSATQDLPVVGTAAIQFTGLGFDGSQFILTAATTGLQKVVALRGNLTGQVTALLAKGETLPGTERVAHSFGASAAADGTVYLQVLDTTFARQIVAWQPDSVKRIVGPGLEVPGFGPIQDLESSFLHAAGGSVWLAVRLSATPGPRRGVIAANAHGIAPAVFPSKLDAQRIGVFEVASVADDRLLLSVMFENGSRAWYANVGTAGDPPLRLDFTQTGTTALRFRLPAGVGLEAVSVLGEAWQPVAGTGDVEVPLSGKARFFRLRRP